MPHTSTPKIRKNAKELRKNLTPAEEKLWVHLRGHRTGDVHFRRQHAIGNESITSSRKYLRIFLSIRT